MRIGGQTKTGMKRKRRKKEAVYLFDEIEKRVKLMNVVAINVLAHALEHNKTEKNDQVHHLKWFLEEKKHHQIGVYVLIENANTLKLKRSFFKYSNRYDI